MYDSIPTAKVASGKALRVASYVRDTDDLEVVYQAPYTWSTSPAFPLETATIEMPVGAEDLPAVYAEAWMVSGREVSRQQLDRAQDWENTEPVRGGQSGALVRAKWQEFYRALDEAKRVTQLSVVPHRPFVPRPKLNALRGV